MTLKLDKYNRVARIYPTIISIIPLTIFVDSLIENLPWDDAINFSLFRILGDASLSIVALYFISQLNRFIGKECFEKLIFKDELLMSTTNLLVPSDTTFSSKYKLQIIAQISMDFNLQINKSTDEEQMRKEIKDVVGLIRSRVKDGHLLLQHNREYGFIRNLIGGSIIGLLFSLINVVNYYGSGELLLLINISFSALFLLLIIGSNWLIKRFGMLYAKRLYQEYLSLE